MSQTPRNDASDLTQWVGRTESHSDRVDTRIAHALAATLNYDPQAIFSHDILPPLWHWVYFTPDILSSEIGSDGHQQRGGFLPLIDLPNRMWAGGRFTFHQPMHIGEKIERVSRILRCERKTGRSGELVFVTVHHTISGENGVALEEEQDIVYRNPTPKDRPLAGDVATTSPEFRQTYHPDPVLLFRYSALTFNSHRIHYDQPYAVGEEGYPGLVVHGPLIATLMLNTFRERHAGTDITNFSFRAIGPLFATGDFDLCGRVTKPGHAELWADCAGRLTMKADVEFV